MAPRPQLGHPCFSFYILSTFNKKTIQCFCIAKSLEQINLDRSKIDLRYIDRSFSAFTIQQLPWCLVVTINNKLDWSSHTAAIYKKDQSRLLLLRSQRSFWVSRTCYATVVASAVSCTIVFWESGVMDRKRKKLVRRASSILGCSLDSIIQEELHLPPPAPYCGDPGSYFSSRLLHNSYNSTQQMSCMEICCFIFVC